MVSASGLSPAAVDLEAGVLIVKDCGLDWNNGYFHRWTVGTEGDLDRDLHCFPPFPCRAVLKPLRGSYLNPKSFNRNKNGAVKSERPPFITADDLPLFYEPLQNGIEEGQGILHSREVVSPTQKRVADIDSTHLASGSVIHNSTYKVGPCELGLYLLTKRILKPDLSSPQLCNLCIEQIAQISLTSDGFLDFLKSFLEGVCHGYNPDNTQTVYRWQA
jgi:hypothetical protein